MATLRGGHATHSQVVKSAAVTVNFDLNRDGMIDVSTWPTPEMNAIIAAAEDLSFDHNILLVDNPSDGSFGFAEFLQRFAFVHAGTHTGAQTVNNTIAHELGHTQDLVHPDAYGDPDPDNLMHSTNTNPEKLRRNQWDTLNPPPPGP